MYVTVEETKMSKPIVQTIKENLDYIFGKGEKLKEEQPTNKATVTLPELIARKVSTIRVNGIMYKVTVEKIDK